MYQILLQKKMCNHLTRNTTYVITECMFYLFTNLFVIYIQHTDMRTYYLKFYLLVLMGERRGRNGP